MSFRLGLGSYAFRWSCGFRDHRPASPLGPCDLIAEARALGLTVVQFADNMPLHLRDADEIAALARAAAAAGITIELGMAGFDPGLLRRYLALARDLGAGLLRIAFDAAEARAGAEALAEAVRTVLPEARAAGVVLAAENHFHIPSPTLRAVAEAVDDPSFGVCLDVANSICAGEWPETTVALLAPFAMNLHLKDYTIVPDPYGVGFRIVGTPLGEGRTDVGAILARLRSAGRAGTVILEHWLPRQQDDAATLAAERDWLARSVATARRHGL